MVNLRIRRMERPKEGTPRQIKVERSQENQRRNPAEVGKQNLQPRTKERIITGERQNLRKNQRIINRRKLRLEEDLRIKKKE